MLLHGRPARTRPDDVVAAAETAYQLFATLAGLDWSATAGDLEWDCRQTLEHVTTVQIFLASNAANESRSRLPGARTNNPDQSIAELVTLHRALANVLAAVLRSMPEDARGFHPAGLADRHGFAAMACTETLVHAADIAQGLGLDFAPPPEIPAMALARLFPWVQDEATRGRRCSMPSAACPSARRSVKRPTGGGTAPRSASGTAR